jgi:steroid delta-isomerase-like uncharacterized protein
MTIEENKAVVGRYIEEFWNQGKASVAAEIISSDYTRHDPSTPWVSGDREGVQQLMIALRSAFPDLHFTIEDQIVAEDTVVVRWRATGQHQGELLGIPATGKPITVTAISIYRLAGGKLSQEWTNWDSLGMMQQLGVVPALA